MVHRYLEDNLLNLLHKWERPRGALWNVTINWEPVTLNTLYSFWWSFFDFFFAWLLCHELKISRVQSINMAKNIWGKGHHSILLGYSIVIFMLWKYVPNLYATLLEKSLYLNVLTLVLRVLTVTYFLTSIFRDLSDPASKFQTQSNVIVHLVSLIYKTSSNKLFI